MSEKIGHTSLLCRSNIPSLPFNAAVQRYGSHGCRSAFPRPLLGTWPIYSEICYISYIYLYIYIMYMYIYIYIYIHIYIYIECDVRSHVVPMLVSWRAFELQISCQKYPQIL